MPEEPVVPSETEPSPSDTHTSAVTRIRAAGDDTPAEQRETSPQDDTPSDASADDAAHTRARESDSVEHANDTEPAEANVSADTSPGPQTPAPEASPEDTSPTPTPQADTDDTTSDSNEETSADFASMVEAAGEAKPEVKVGERLRGHIVSIDDENTFIDYSGRAEARIATSELRDKNQKVVLRVGDALSATVSSVDDGVVVTLGRRRGVVHAARLRVAFENKVPVRGTIKAMNKGGFDVQVGGIRTFCPLSQIDRTYIEDPQAWVGKSFSFRVLRWENAGRNIVVTRRALLEEEAAEKAVETRKKLAVDAEFEGQVTRIQPFGAFIDIGGLEGLLHVSRLGHGRVADPRSVVQPGQTLPVRVLAIENEGTRKERISLGRADLGPDPWETLTQEHKEGDVVTGTVARLTDFGAFVQLAPGVDGLVHISEIASERIQHPQEVLKAGQEIEVRILRIEGDKHRISLSIRQVSADAPSPRPRREARAPKRQESAATGAGTLTHTMADQLGALKRKLKEQQ